ncbi:MAG: ChbG/HpnK family deacetylase, partial [Promicromonosporaceae bacterium]|nr:ChbG/HpnK family deacetylase [Promicromonosporaceae bacterium]
GWAALLALSVLRPRELARQAEAEMRAQIRWALDRGLALAHLDSHRHAHMIPVLFRVAGGLRAEYGIPRLRRVNESLRATWAGAGLGRAWLDGGVVKWAALRACGWLAGPAAAAGEAGAETYFYSILHATRLHGRALRRLKVPGRFGAVELCFHPCQGGPEAEGVDRATADAFLLDSPNRRLEYEALMGLDPPEP